MSRTTSSPHRLDRLPASAAQLARERAQFEEIELLSELMIRANESPAMLRSAEIDRILGDAHGDQAVA